jgi:hypothetical protein
MPPKTCRLFISYAHDSAEHKEFILEYANWLNNPGGLDCWIDRYVEDAMLPEGWPLWMRNQLSEANFVLVVCSPKFLERFEHKLTEEGKGKGVKFESTLMMNDIYQKGSMNDKFIPVVLKSDHEKYIPDILQTHTFYDLSNKERKIALYRKLTGQPLVAKPTVSKSIIELSGIDIVNNEAAKDIETSGIKELLNMKPGTKLFQAFFSLPVTKRFTIAKELGLLDKGEEIEAGKNDKLSSLFLERAFQKQLLAALWSKLFNEQIDPNPFKQNSK